MEFGLFTEFHSPPGVTEAAAFDESLAQMKAAEDFGFDAVWLAEIHFQKDRSVLAARVPFQLQDGSRHYWLPYGIGTPASILTSLLQAEGWDARVGPATTQRVAQTQILDGSGGTAVTTVAWLQSYFGGVVSTVAPPASGPTVTVIIGSDFTIKTFPVP